MSSDLPPNDDANQPPKQRWALARSLNPGEEVIVNGRDEILVVAEVTRRTSGDSVTRITLTGSGTTYTITLAEEAAVPVLTWPSAAHSHPVQEIRAVGTTILSTGTVSDLLPSITGCSEHVDTEPKKQSWEGAVDLTRLLGSCPLCGSVVVKDQQRALCRACGSWSWIEQWEAFDESSREAHKLPENRQE